MYKTTSAFYFNEFDGTILTQDNAEKSLCDAAVDVWNMCSGKEPKTPFQKKMYEMAICAQAEANLSSQSIPNGLTSFSIDGLSYSFDNTKNKIDTNVKKYLLPTGLLNRCL